MSAYRLYPTLATLFLLTACSGGSDPSVTPPQQSKAKLAGKVIDGYVSGATVWIDLNNNGTRDASEPSVVSGSAGNYAFELTDSQRQCAQYATLYVDVPVGAIDEDLGEVTEAYQMVRPPVLDAITDDSLLHISPLTTVLWQGIRESFGREEISDCNALLADQAKRNEIKSVMQQSIDQMVSFYNMSEAVIFADFIADANSEAKTKAQDIVKGLQQSFALTKTLSEDYPSAQEVRVVHYFGTHAYYTDDQDAHWFRKVLVSEGDSYFSRDDLVSQDLSDVITPVYYRDVIDSVWAEGQLFETRDVIYRGVQQGYQCSLDERVKVQSNGVTYSLSNLAYNSTFVAEVDACGEISEDASSRAYTVTYEDAGRTYFADMRQHQVSFSLLTNWVSLVDKAAELDLADLIAELSATGYAFTEQVTIPTTSWYKRQYWYEGNTYFQIDYDQDGNWTKYTRFADGTHTDECSYDQGASWQACQ